MRPVEERPVYSMTNPLDQPANGRYIFFTPDDEMMGLRIVCDSAVTYTDGTTSVKDTHGRILATVSVGIKWQLVDKFLLTEEPFATFADRHVKEEKVMDDMKAAVREKYYGKAAARKQRAPQMMMMMPTEEGEEEQPTPPDAKAESGDRPGHYL